jgi:hypothetical protein
MLGRRQLGRRLVGLLLRGGAGYCASPPRLALAQQIALALVP